MANDTSDTESISTLEAQQQLDEMKGYQPTKYAESSSDSGDPSSDDDDDASTTKTPQASSSMIKIFARIRPPKSNQNIKSVSQHKKYTIDTGSDQLPKIGFKIPKDESQGIINNSKENYEFQFNRIFDVDTTQEEVFDVVAKDVCQSVLDGYNGTIFAYGQTGSGKTFTITGGAEKYADRGIIPRSIQYMFKQVQQRSGYHYEFKISYLEIYNETGYDLLDTSREAKHLEDLPKVTLQEDENEMIHLKNLSAIPAANEEEALNQLFVGDTNKMIAETPSNPASSRSHCIFIISVTSKKEGEDVIRKSKLHLVDLAGSERVSRTQIDGNLLKEAKYINLSLHYLEQVIVALHQKALGKRTHVPYRNSMMTSVLRDSLGGNCKTTMIATAAIEDPLIEETISTCRFAQRVALITNSVRVNEERDPQMVIARLKGHIARLKAELAIARGEGADGAQELPDYEKERVKQAVDEYIGDDRSDAVLVLNDYRKIHEAFRIMKHYILQRPDTMPISSDPTASIETTGSSHASPSDKKWLDQIDKLKFLVSHRDNEIEILLGMVNEYKEKYGALQVNKKEKKLKQAHPLSSLSTDAFLSASLSEPSSCTTTTSTVSPSLSGGVSPSLSSRVQSSLSSSVQPTAQSSLSSTAQPTVPPPQTGPLPPEKAKAFEIFKSGYPAGSWIDGQKQLLKLKYSEAKALGEKANTMRNDIKKLKECLSQSNEQESAELEDEKEEMKNELGEAITRYKEAYQQLKDLKIEIEHLHHLLDQARLRLTRDFEHWYATVYLSTAFIPSDSHNTLRDSTQSLSFLNRADSGKQLMTTQDGMKLKETAFVDKSLQSIPNQGANMAYTSSLSDKLSSSTHHRTPSSYSTTSTLASGSTLVSHKSETSLQAIKNDIQQFYKARSELLKKSGSQPL